ncbi:MAG: hypothetical protein DWI00_03295 [Planctomycetota bacterium]|nr:MAG: hypothetical protein DWI00_03295 [Planctomycetota bacterium]
MRCYETFPNLILFLSFLNSRFILRRNAGFSEGCSPACIKFPSPSAAAWLRSSQSESLTCRIRKR